MIQRNIDGIYPLVNVDKTMERSTMLFMGKLAISMATFNFIWGPCVGLFVEDS